MSRQHWLDFQFVEAALNLLRPHTGVLEFVEQPAQGHRWRRIVGEVPAAGALFAEIHELEEQAEGVRNLVGLLDAETVDERGAGFEAGGGVLLSRSNGEVANLVQLAENTFARLFADDRVKAPGQKGNFLS
jgi:hypothetical protein